MDLFGFNRFFLAPEDGRPPKKGPARYFQVLWENLGGLLGGNLLTFAGFLPLALGVSLGVVYENIWLTLLGGGLGGALAGAFWTPMLSLAFQAFRGGTRGWFGRWRQAFFLAPGPSAGLGAFIGLLAGAFLLAGTIMVQAAGAAGTSRLTLPMVSLALCLDCLLLALLATLCFSVFCAGGKKGVRSRTARTVLFSAPGRTFAAAVGVLLWCALGAALFPVSVPFALLAGFWPGALFTAQLLLPALETQLDLSACGWEEPAPSPLLHRTELTAGQRREIFWRRRWPVVAALAGLALLTAWGGSQLLSRREPDLQIAVVHRTALPDGVRTALERSLAAAAGDLNGDGQAVVLVNDYTVVFDGSAADSDLQTAGSALLVSDLAAGSSSLYLVEDPDGFLARYAGLVDGDSPRCWAGCPVLAGLDAGTWFSVDGTGTTLSGQSLLASLAVLPSLKADSAVLDILLGR